MAHTHFVFRSLAAGHSSSKAPLPSLFRQVPFSVAGAVHSPGLSANSRLKGELTLALHFPPKFPSLTGGLAH